MESCIPWMHKVFFKSAAENWFGLNRDLMGIYVLFLIFIFDVYILIFICDIGTNVLKSQICH